MMSGAKRARGWHHVISVFLGTALELGTTQSFAPHSAACRSSQQVARPPVMQETVAPPAAPPSCLEPGPQRANRQRKSIIQ
jgi:hypothetical protein